MYEVNPDDNAYPTRTDVTFRRGLSTRQLFAMEAMKSWIIAKPEAPDSDIVRCAIYIADELIKQLNQSK